MTNITLTTPQTHWRGPTVPGGFVSLGGIVIAVKYRELVPLYLAGSGTTSTALRGSRAPYVRPREACSLRSERCEFRKRPPNPPKLPSPRLVVIVVAAAAVVVVVGKGVCVGDQYT
eukprot:6466891-Amphidinium_carterae.1